MAWLVYYFCSTEVKSRICFAGPTEPRPMLKICGSKSPAHYENEWVSRGGRLSSKEFIGPPRPHLKVSAKDRENKSSCAGQISTTQPAPIVPCSGWSSRIGRLSMHSAISSGESDAQPTNHEASLPPYRGGYKVHSCSITPWNLATRYSQTEISRNGCSHITEMG
ncbi:MAG: hypothetical protein CL912_08580 [Deltaproteobacteria bacterium]|nr:hypothetical protein [Deltaproteobacteria bacterium]